MIHNVCGYKHHSNNRHSLFRWDCSLCSFLLRLPSPLWSFHNLEPSELEGCRLALRSCVEARCQDVECLSTLSVLCLVVALSDCISYLVTVMESYSELVSICPFPFYIYYWLNIRVSDKGISLFIRLSGAIAICSEETVLSVVQLRNPDTCTYYLLKFDCNEDMDMHRDALCWQLSLDSPACAAMTCRYRSRSCAWSGVGQSSSCVAHRSTW